MSHVYSTHPSFKNWMKKHFNRQEMRDIVNYGVSGGFPGLTYYHQTVALYRKYHNDIWQMLNEDAESTGHQHALSLIAAFSGAGHVSDRDTFENLLVWHAAEHITADLTR